MPPVLEFQRLVRNSIAQAGQAALELEDPVNGVCRAGFREVQLSLRSEVTHNQEFTWLFFFKQGHRSTGTIVKLDVHLRRADCDAPPLTAPPFVDLGPPGVCRAEASPTEIVGLCHDPNHPLELRPIYLPRLPEVGRYPPESTTRVKGTFRNLRFVGGSWNADFDKALRSAEWQVPVEKRPTTKRETAWQTPAGGYGAWLEAEFVPTSPEGLKSSSPLKTFWYRPQRYARRRWKASPPGVGLSSRSFYAPLPRPSTGGPFLRIDFAPPRMLTPPTSFDLRDSKGQKLESATWEAAFACVNRAMSLAPPPTNREADHYALHGGLLGELFDQLTVVFEVAAQAIPPGWALHKFEAGVESTQSHPARNLKIQSTSRLQGQIDHEGSLETHAVVSLPDFLRWDEGGLSFRLANDEDEKPAEWQRARAPISSKDARDIIWALAIWSGFGL